jgi:hypothetical protein
MLPPALITPLVVAGVDIESSSYTSPAPALGQTMAVTNKLGDASAALDPLCTREAE